MTNLVRGSDTYPATRDEASAGNASETDKLFANVLDDRVSNPN
jgi:hypothetical protein